jgi:purine-binding chemotaxis protein CheW
VRSADRSVAMVVDSAREFISIDPSTIQPPPEGVSGMSGKYLEGIAHVNERLILILDPAQIIDGPVAAGV